jgi:hypothetical protein
MKTNHAPDSSREMRGVDQIARESAEAPVMAGATRVNDEGVKRRRCRFLGVAPGNDCEKKLSGQELLRISAKDSGSENLTMKMIGRRKEC